MGVYRNVLVAVDLSGEAERVLARAQAVAPGASFTLMHVVEPLISESPYQLAPAVGIEIEQQMEDRSRLFLTSLAKKSTSGTCQVVVQIGSVKGAILAYVRDHQIDLVVIGTHGRHGLGILLGSTANAVLHGTPCDVLSVRVGDH